MQYNDPNSTPSTIGNQIRTDYYQKKALIELKKEQYFSPLADTVTMPKHFGKTIKDVSLAEAAMDPARVLRQVAGQAASLPALQDLTGLRRFLQDMRDAGLPLRLAEEFPPEPEAVRLAARRAG